jgi:hypothetical protein
VWQVEAILPLIERHMNITGDMNITTQSQDGRRMFFNDTNTEWYEHKHRAVGWNNGKNMCQIIYHCGTGDIH